MSPRDPFQRAESTLSKISLRHIVIGIVCFVAVTCGVPSSFVYINPGNVGIVIHKIGGGGVDPTPLGPGVHARNPLATGIEEYPTYMQTLVLTKTANEGSPNNDEINVNSVEGQPISLDATLSFDLDPSKTPYLYKTFRTELPQITHGYVKQTIRQAVQEVVGQEEIAGIIGPKKAELVARVQSLLTTRLAPFGIVVKQFTVNEIRPPQSIINAIGQKNTMAQEALTAQNELAKKKFIAQGDSIAASGRANAVLVEAKARAEANRLTLQATTPALIEYMNAESRKIAAQKWDGTLPTTIFGNTVPMVQLPTSKP